MWDVGVNLGGWLSQYGKFSERHFDSFITERDYDAIRAAGFDHVRLPVDYPVIEEGRGEGWGPREAGLERIDRALGWAEDRALGLVLDLHSAPGFRFQDFARASLFADGATQERFVGLWAGLARRYSGAFPSLMFELMNEIVMPDVGPWNDLADRTIRAIRDADPDRHILIGGNRYNAPDALSELRLFDDPRVLYSFHFYEPHPFTHQGAPWVKAYEGMKADISYPGTAARVEEKIRRDGGRTPDGTDLSRYSGARFDRAYLEAELAPALAFRERNGKRLYCGEYGSFDSVDAESRRQWTREVSSLLSEAGIGRAYWTWKRMSFGLVDARGRASMPGLMEAVLLR